VERWEQVEEIFHEALQRDPVQRDVYLRQACGGDSALQREIADLLAHHQECAESEPWAAAAAAQLIAAPVSLQPGQLLGPYRIESFVAAGGMGQVYRATDTRLNREVAIKICAGRFSERFAQEARVIASLNHPHICHLYDVGPNYLVMELVEGTSLRGPLSLTLAVEYAGQILDALETAHRKGITHRDLKPANILVTKQGVKLLDFGLAKRSTPLQESDATLTAALTGKGEIPGTLQYMSPEQLQGKEADPRSDLFSFGCVFYEMLAGKRAFEGESAASVIAAILEREPAPLDIASPMERVIRACLTKDPDHRFQNALDLKTALTWAAEQFPIPAESQSRRWWILGAVATLVVGALGGEWAVSRFHHTLDDRVLRLQIDPPPRGRFDTTFGSGLAISPDGKTVAYVASVNGKTGLWVRPLDSPSARLLPGTENAAWPFWSPDSKSIAFIAGRSTLRRVDLVGGMPVQIADPALVARGGFWGSNGNILYTALAGVLRVPASGGKVSLIAGPDASRGEAQYNWPQELPGGRFLYYVQSNKPEIRGVYAASLAKPADRVKLLTTESNALYASVGDGHGYLLWGRNGGLVAQEFNPRTLQFAGDPLPLSDGLSVTADALMDLAVSANGILVYGKTGAAAHLKWLDRAGKVLGELGEPMEAIDMFRPSPDQRQIAVQYHAGGLSDLWLLDAERGVPSRLTADSRLNSQPVWSPDGRTILFVHLDANDLLRIPANGIGAPQVVLQRPRPSIPLDWSRDGRWVLTRERSPETGYDIWKLPMTPDGTMQQRVAPTPYLQTRFNEGQARFSPEPNPRWVAYMSDESGRPEVYIDAFPEPRGKKRISTAGGAGPSWRADGRELFFISPENKLMAVSLKVGVEAIEPSAPRELFQLPVRSSSAGPAYQPGLDGQRFLVLTSPEIAPQSLNVIVNWPALLKKGAAAPGR